MTHLNRVQEYFHLPDNNVIGAYVVAPECAQCGKRPKGSQFMLALPKPYHCLLHEECIAFFDFSGAWPHRLPAHFYVTRNRRRSAPPGLLEQSQ